MFRFRLVVSGEGIEIIDTTQSTDAALLTPIQLMEYQKVDSQLAFVERIRRERQKELERRKKIKRNPLYKLCLILRLI